MKDILLVDDLAIVRYGATHLLNELFPGVRVKTAGNIDEMIEQLDKNRFDLLILDIDFPGGSGFGTIDIILLRQRDIKILVFSGFDKKLYAARYIEAGAHGFLSKHESERKLHQAITTILQGDIYVSTG